MLYQVLSPIFFLVWFLLWTMRAFNGEPLTYRVMFNWVGGFALASILLLAVCAFIEVTL